ncbi:MAG TPA: ZIP family metal transporter [Alphaproteobacteria bacterium]
MAVHALDPIVLGTLGSLAAGLGTSVGALPILVLRDPVGRQSLLLGFAAGIMLAATGFSLILPGIEEAARRTGDEDLAVLIVAAGILIGAVALSLAHRLVPHEHFFKGLEGADPRGMARLWLFVLAITLHNFPEGLAVGIGFAEGDIENGLPLALGIGLQNLPEGLAVAAAMTAEGYTRRAAFAVAALTGLVEPAAGFFGAAAVSIATGLLPWGLAFAAGAMLFVISGEIIPETHRTGREVRATFALVVGFVVMMTLDVVFG